MLSARRSRGLLSLLGLTLMAAFMVALLNHFQSPAEPRLGPLGLGLGPGGGNLHYHRPKVSGPGLGLGPQQIRLTSDQIQLLKNLIQKSHSLKSPDIYNPQHIQTNLQNLQSSKKIFNVNKIRDTQIRIKSQYHSSKPITNSDNNKISIVPLVPKDQWPTSAVVAAAQLTQEGGPAPAPPVAAVSQDSIGLSSTADSVSSGGSSSSSNDLTSSSSSPSSTAAAAVAGQVSSPTAGPTGERGSGLQNASYISAAIAAAYGPASGYVPAKPKPVFDTADLLTTHHLLIDKPNHCDTDRGAAYDLLVMVTSAISHFDARVAIRATWGEFALDRGSLLLFLVGAPPPGPAGEAIQRLVEAEDSQYGDILQGGFLDSYYNLTLKSLTMLRWVAANCDQVKYVLKVDDDMFVNMQLLVDFCETRLYPRSIIGKLAKGWKPHREASSKWYIPRQAFGGAAFPTFATGPAYLYTGDAARPLLNATGTRPPVYLEDVYVTGIAAEGAKIRRLNHALMRNVHLKSITACNFPKFITSHMHSPAQIRQLWQEVYSPPAVPCPAPPPPPPKPKAGPTAVAAKAGPAVQKVKPRIKRDSDYSYDDEDLKTKQPQEVIYRGEKIDIGSNSDT